LWLDPVFRLGLFENFLILAARRIGVHPFHIVAAIASTGKFSFARIRVGSF
jgi:hypothetical protein